MAHSKKPKEKPENWRLATSLIHKGTERSQFGETSEAIFLTSGYVYPTAEEAEGRFAGDRDGHVYSRYTNPTVRMFEERMMALEGAEEARATASGMAAVTASMLCQLKAGDHVVSARALFGSCRYIIEKLLPQYGISFTFVDGRDLKAWEEAVRDNSKLFFLESPANPTLEIIDIEKVADIAHGKGASLVVDNVFATPLLQQPLTLGADIIVYSATKHIDGQGRCLGGIVLGTKSFIEEKLHDYYKHTGPSLSPFNAWNMLKGLETLPLRVAAHVTNAERLADHLAAHKEVQTVLYPGRPDHPQFEIAKKQMLSGGPLIAFDIAGGKGDAFRFMNALKIIKISNNLGDAKSLITHPATTTHQRLSPEERAELGIGDNLVRLSVGLEDKEDLIEDIDQALINMEKHKE